MLSCQHLTAVCMHIFSFTYTFSWHMHAHLHRHTCLSHARTHTRSNATVVTGFCSSFPLAEFPFPLFSVILLRLLQKKKKKKKKKFLIIYCVYARVDAARWSRDCTSIWEFLGLVNMAHFFTVTCISRRKKNFLLLRSWMAVDEKVNVSNHFSKNHDAHHSCTFAKALKTPQRRRPLARRKQARCTLSSH